MTSDDISRRLAALSPEQRRLLELRIRAGERDGPAAPSAQHEAPGDAVETAPPRGARSARMAFSLFFFSAAGSTDARDKYRLLLESARFADRHGFAAVWTPERHFQEFGGLYPNPSILAASLAMITDRIRIRAGSVAAPLHHPIRIAEEWSVVDNLSGGRAEVAFASGWYASDFVLAPDHYAARREILVRHVDAVQRLWRGEPIAARSGDGSETEVRTLPRPLQRELPIWITTSGNPETWSRAGELGAGVLAALAGQSVDDLARKVAVYHDALEAHGFGRDAARVAVMLHTFIGDDLRAVRAAARGPLRTYIRTHFQQREHLFAIDRITPDDRNELLGVAVEHYLAESSLIGTADTCAATVDRLAAIGVNEIACLIDFGMDADAVLQSLDHLNALRERFDRGPEPGARAAEGAHGAG